MMKSLHQSGWIPTYTGRQFWPLQPRASDVCIEDIAHHLSNECRFTGATAKFYSVAQHSVLASYLVPAEDALWALLHDASEAYLRDIAKPVKEQPAFEAYKLAEDRLNRVIADAFSLGWPMPDSIKTADAVLLATERRDFIQHRGLAWNVGAEPHSARIVPWPPELAESCFLERYGQLCRQRFGWLKAVGLIPREAGPRSYRPFPSGGIAECRRDPDYCRSTSV
jgi:hypothetical protein